MKIETYDDVDTFLRMHIAAGALGAALELGLFWHLDKNPLGVQDISQKMNIPLDRTRSWLDLLVEFGLLERQNDKYFSSQTSQKTILKKHCQESWAFLAQEARDRYLTANNLAIHITHPESVWKAQGLEPPNYFASMLSKDTYAEQFTVMLYERHLEFAYKFAQTFDMTDVNTLLDLGGGSGVISLALLKQHPGLTSVVLDIDVVCETGRKIAAETPVANRIMYQIADLDKDDFPQNFDMVLMCDVGTPNEEMCQKSRNSLNEGGSLVIITNFDPLGTWLVHDKKPPLQWFINSFSSSLQTPKLRSTTPENVKKRLIKAGFLKVSIHIWDEGEVIIQGFK